MKQQTFTIEIKAPKEKVWNAMWTDENYRKWTAAFCEGSYAKSSWKQGERVHFLTPNGDGMYSELTKLVPNEKMHFTHIGNIKNFEEQPLDEEAKAWTGAKENYTLTEQNENTIVTVEMDIVEQYWDYFNETFGKGLATIKEIAES
jgi:uncharacterized protein YndB with AHSA1/START domain